MGATREEIECQLILHQFQAARGELQAQLLKFPGMN